MYYQFHFHCEVVTEVIATFIDWSWKDEMKIWTSSSHRLAILDFQRYSVSAVAFRKDSWANEKDLFGEIFVLFFEII